MTLDETRRLLSFISAVSPSQRIGPDTAEAWHVLLLDVDYDSAYSATKRIARRERYVGVEAIVKEVEVPKPMPRRGEWGECPEHPGQWLTSCSCCRADRLVGETV